MNVTTYTIPKTSISAAAFIAVSLFFGTVQAGGDTDPKNAQPNTGRTVWEGAHIGAQTGWENLDYGPGMAGGLLALITNRASNDSFVLGALYGTSLHYGNWVIGTDSTYYALDVLTGLNMAVPGAAARAKIDWSSETRGRLGYLVRPNTLVFGTVGMAFANINVAGTLIADGQTETTAFGVIYGGGVEVTVRDRWFARIEYLHADYGDETFAATDGATLSVDLDTDVVRSAIGYRFSWSPLDLFIPH